MLQNKNKRTWWKVFMVFVLALLTAISVPSAATMAKTANKQRTLLNTTIKYCVSLKSTGYTAASWKTFQKELKEAKAVYKKTSKKTDVYTSARDDLEKAKANLVFVTSTSKGNPLPYRTLTVNQIVSEMGAGWNLGNTMDGHTGFTPTETTWQSVVTTKKLIKAVHDAGFNTIRIPVTWGTKIDDKNGYKLDEAWISRVQDIVDYAVSQDMYVIINVHHDGAEQLGWLRVAADNIDPVYTKFECVWRNIAERFKDYDEHLIFESMNEIKGDGSDFSKDMKVINNLNQIFLNVVRSTGSNNSVRWLSVPGRYTNIETTTNAKLGFRLPTDTVKNRLFVSVHYYDYSFGLLENMGTTTFSNLGVSHLDTMLKSMADTFTSKGVPVILGEYGAINKNNTAERAYHYEAVARICQKYGIVACAWDSGDYNLTKAPADYSFSLFDRKTGKSIYPDIVSAIMRGTYLPSSTADYSDIVKSPVITKITDVTLSDTALSMTINDSKKVTATVTPGSTNDVVLWKTSDPTVATVSNGNVRARGIGTATITAFTQSGSVTKDITVTVAARTSAKPCTAIKTDSDSYDIVKGKYIDLNAAMTPEDTDDYITYRSSDEAVATVSALGKVVGCGIGTADITMTASNGITRTIKVNVVTSLTKLELPVALNVYFNDDKTGYYANECGDSIMITGDGTYTVTFDCSKNLSDAAKKAGVNSLTNLTAIYIKDNNVTLGKTTKSPLKTCNIKYDKVVVDGVALTITQTKVKSAIKPNGVFDTNDPMNSWDGSQVKEVSVTNHVLNITEVKNPKLVSVTFTISGMEFEE